MLRVGFRASSRAASSLPSGRSASSVTLSSQVSKANSKFVLQSFTLSTARSSSALVTSSSLPSRTPLPLGAKRWLSGNEQPIVGTTTNTPKQYAFQAETSKILDIVSRSLYSNRDVFVRELVSNASDALEKLRRLGLSSGSEVGQIGQEDLEINITTDTKNNTLIIEDTGIGMNEQDLITFLGTIGKSGAANIAKTQAEGQAADNAIIGQFGVGFYSAFMAGTKVDVESKSAKLSSSDTDSIVWSSNGVDSYTLERRSSPTLTKGRGTKITIHLRPDATEFTDPNRVREIIERYSRYVSFPVNLNGERVNTLEAVWITEPNKVTPEKHKEFFKFQFKQFDDPLYTLHFRTDAPKDIKALLYVPKDHEEHAGMARMEPGVSLYTRKVLIQANSPDLLPNWARFVKGIVDSEDLPLSLSRDSPQDVRVVKRMGQAVTRRLIRHLREQSVSDPETYKQFWSSHGHFIKEGVVSDPTNRSDLAKLLRFDTSFLKPGENLCSLDDIIGRLPAGCSRVYFLSAPSRSLAEASPYYEIFKNANMEVIFLYHTLDDFVLNNLHTYQDRQLIAAESGKAVAEDVELFKKATSKAGEADATSKKEEDDKSSSGTTSASASLSEAESKDLCQWMLIHALNDHVVSVTPTKRLRDSPALVVDHESASLRRMMKMVDAHEKHERGSDGLPLAKQKLEINPNHELIKRINSLRTSDRIADQNLANRLARHVLDGALVAAGIVDDPREMIPRMNALVQSLLSGR